VNIAPLHRWHLLLAILIAYGSLYPFDFTWPESAGAALRQMLSNVHPWTSKGDALGNLLLFLPWGLASAAQARPAKHLASALGLALAVLLQILQIGLPSRDAALADIIWNGAGIYIGQFALAPVAQRLRATRTNLLEDNPLPCLLLLAWLLIQTLPCIPSLDFALLRAGIRAFLAPRPWSLAAFVVTFASILVLGHAALILAPTRTLALAALAAALPIVLGARLFIIQNTPHWHEAAAMMAGYIGVLALRQPQRIAPFAFVAMLLGLTLAALAPYEFSSPSGSFGWLPFASLLRGNRVDNLRELLEIAWHCAALLWLAHNMGARLQGIGIFIVFWVLLLEIVQLWLPARGADATPALICALIIPSLIRLSRRKPEAAPVSRQADFSEPPPQARKHASSKRHATRKSHDGGERTNPPRKWRHTLAWALPCWLGGTMLLAWLIRQPGIPYNLRESFLGDGHPLAIAIFMLALMTLGAGPRLALGKALQTNTAALRLPLHLCAAGIVTLLMLLASVTDESLKDIAGSNVFHHRVSERGVLGTWMAGFFRDHVAAAIVSPFEATLRFLALYLPPAACLALMLVWLELRRGWKSLAAMALTMLPVLLLCKLIAFDWSSTDNLNELIAPDGEYGWGGGGYLYLLLTLLAANIALVARPSGPIWPRGLFTLLSLPLSWWLLKHGLAAVVEKYGLLFSGPQFLLGPDRATVLAEHLLRNRWMALHLALVLAGAAGVAIGRAIEAQPPGRRRAPVMSSTEVP
jgi:VanZ family protein